MESDLAIHGVAAWLRMLLGIAIWLCPGLAITDRIFTHRRGLLMAPVFSFTAMTLVAVVLDFGFAIPINTWTTGLIAGGLTAWAGWPRGMQLLAWARRRWMPAVAA